jgi:hypothetical protein
MPALLPSPLLATSAEAGAAAEDIDLDLRCPICFALMLQPRVLPGCKGQVSHAFCAPCIAHWLQLQKDGGLPPTCPIDRRVIEPDEQVARSPQLEAAISRLLVQCPNHTLGCTARFELSDGGAHLGPSPIRRPRCLPPAPAPC